MKKLQLSFIVLFVPIIVALSCSSKKNDVSIALMDIELLRGEITLCGNQEFGEVSFGLSCNVDVRETFDLALSLLHSFEYDEAEKGFVSVIDADPECAMAYWGIAMSNFHSLWLQTGTGFLEKGEKILAAAENLPTSEREEGYLDAMRAYYDDWETLDRTTRIKKFEKKMEILYTQNKNDKEAAIFYALAIRAAANPADKTYASQIKSGKLLESIYPNQPNHPGIAHYLIHNYDYPELAKFALPIARRYAKIAPGSAHAQHMPSHIFTRLGLWEESINSNINSTSSALCYSQSIDPESHWDEELHGMDYLVYAYLQVGESKKANEQYEYLKSFKKVFPVNNKIAHAAAAIPSRIALENRDWQLASNLNLPEIGVDWKDFPWQNSILHFARAIGSLRSGDINAGEIELSILKKFKQELVELNDPSKANLVQVEIKTVEAWVDFKKGNKTNALVLMKEAANMEYNTSKGPITPGEVLPAGELLADMLFDMDKYEEALIAYEFDLTQHPNRFNGLYGAAISARAMGDFKKSEKYYKQLALLNSDRIEIKEAKMVVNL